jgi:hypothetical protein
VARGVPRHTERVPRGVQQSSVLEACDERMVSSVNARPRRLESAKRARKRGQRVAFAGRRRRAVAQPSYLSRIVFVGSTVITLPSLPRYTLSLGLEIAVKL